MAGAEKTLTCPRCQRPHKFWWNTVKHKGTCYRCGFSGGGAKWFLEVFGENPPTPRSADRELTPYSRNFVAPYQSTNCATYLATRGCSQDLAADVRMRFDPDHQEVWVPIHSPVQPQQEWVRRSIIQSGWMGDAIAKSVYWFGREPWIPGRNLTLVEGVFDLLSPGLWHWDDWRIGRAMLGARLSGDLRLWLQQQGKPHSVTLWLDPDFTGLTRAQELLAWFRSWVPGPVEHVIGWAFDQRDPGEYSREEARALFAAVSQQRTPTPRRGG